MTIFESLRPDTSRGGKIGPVRWVSPIRPKLGSGWAIKFLAQKKPDQIWLGPVWSGPAWLTRIFFCLEKTIGPIGPFLGRAGLLKFWPEKIGPILARKNRTNFGPARFWPDPLLARPGFGPAHCWPYPVRPGPLDCHL